MAILGIFLASCAGNVSPALPPSSTAAPSPSPTTPAPTFTPDPTDTPQPSPGLQPVDIEGLHLEFWHVWPGDLGNLIQQVTDEFNASNPYGITVEAQAQEDIAGRVRDAIVEGSPPNLVVGTVNQALSWDLRGDAITNLSPYARDPNFGFPPQELADFYPLFWMQSQIEGKQMGIPMYRSGAVLFYNQTWARELGFDSPPATPEEFRQQACAAALANKTDTDPANDGTGGWLISTHPSSVLSWIFAFGGQVTSPAGNYVFQTPQTETAFSFLRELADAGCAWSPGNTFAQEEFAARQGLFAASSISRLKSQTRAFERAGNLDEWAAIPFPGEDANLVVSVFGPDFLILNITPEEQLASWVFVKFLSQPEIQARWVAATGFFPTRQSTLDFLDEYTAETPQWSVLPDMVPRGMPEPRLSSWGTVRWVLSDAANELFSFGFELENISELVEVLDATVQEVDALNP